MIFVLEPKVPSPKRQGTLSIHLGKDAGELPPTSELECPTYNDIFDNCPWTTGDCMTICWNGEGRIDDILFNAEETELNPDALIVKYFWFFEYIRDKQ